MGHNDSHTSAYQMLGSLLSPNEYYLFLNNHSGPRWPLSLFIIIMKMENPSNRQMNCLQSSGWAKVQLEFDLVHVLYLHAILHTGVSWERRGTKEPRWKQINRLFSWYLCVCSSVSLGLWCLGVYALIHFRTPPCRHLPPPWPWASPEEPGYWVPMLCELHWGSVVWRGA